MATVTNSRRRGERSSGSNKVAASKPKLRQTSVANRGVQSGTPKPGTYTSNNTMAKKPSPTNKRGGAQRKTGGKAGGRAGKPSGPVAGTKDKTVRVPSSWKAQTVDPTNQRGGNQRPTGGQAGGRAGRPAGNIARPKPKAPAAKPPAAKPPQRALPAAGQSGGSKPPKGTTTPMRGGPTLTAAQAAQLRRSAAAARAAGASRGQRAAGVATRVARGGAKALNIRSAIVGAIADRTLSPLAQKAGTALGKGPLTTLGRAIDDRLPGINSKDEGRRKAPKSFNEKAYASQQKFNVPKPKAPPKAKPVAPARSSAPSRSSAPGRSTTSARTTASRPAAKPAAKPKASSSPMTESSMMSASDIMKGYGMRVNQTFSAQSPSTPKKRESLKDQTASIKKMIEESKKRQGKG